MYFTISYIGILSPKPEVQNRCLGAAGSLGALMGLALQLQEVLPLKQKTRQSRINSNYDRQQKQNVTILIISTTIL